MFNVIKQSWTSLSFSLFRNTKTFLIFEARFPAEELVVARVKYNTATGPLPAIRETASHKNIDYTDILQTELGR